MEDPTEPRAGSQSATPTAISRDGVAVDTRVNDPAQLDPNRRVYETSRCVFRGGYVAPKYLDQPLLGVAQRAAPLVTQIPDATADVFLYDLLGHSPYRDRAGLRIDGPHIAAAEFCDELSRYFDNYPRFRRNPPSKPITASERAELKAQIESFGAEFRAIADRDLNGKAEETARLNEAYRSGLPLWKGKHGFAVEFPDDAFSAFSSSGNGIPSPSAMGTPHLSQQMDFRESRHSLHADVPHEEELKQEFGRLAHAAIMAMTLGTSVPRTTVDDWIEWPDLERYHCNGDIRKLLIASTDYLSARGVNELGLGNVEKGRQFNLLAAEFRDVFARFFKELDAAPVTESTQEKEWSSKPVSARTEEELKLERSRQLAEAQKRWNTPVPFAWIHRAAGVDHKDAYNWKNGKLPESSVMSEKIEAKLAQQHPPPNPKPE